MNFELNDAQAMLKETVERLLAARYDFEARRRLTQEPEGWSRALWAELAEMGLLAAPFAEADGGLGFGPVETMVVAEALGARLVAEPYLPTVVMAAAALNLSDNAALRAELVPQIAAGELIVAVAPEPGVTASRSNGAWRLDGHLGSVPFADSADRMVVAADEGVFLIDLAAEGVSRRGHRTFDGLRAAEVTLSGVEVAENQVLAGSNADLAERIRQHAIAAMAAEAVGLMSMLLDATIEHLKTRKQFGQPLASFQALKHRSAEMAVAIEQARSMAIYAAMMVDDPDAEERRRAFAAVKSVIGTSGRFVGQNAVQLHGGVGVTEEHRAGWGLRRLTMIDMMFGDADSHAAELARLGGFVGRG